MLIAGIIMMVAGFVGVLVCAKLHLQPVAVVCAVVMLAGLGIYAYGYMNPAPSRDGEIYTAACAKKIGDHLKAQCGGKKVIWITDAESAKGAFIAKSLEAFEKAYGSKPEIKSPEQSEEGDLMVKAQKLDKLFEGLDDSAVVVIDTMLPMDIKNFKAIKAAKGPKIFLTQNASVMEGGKLILAALEKDIVVGLIAGKAGSNQDFKPSDSDLEAAFNEHYVLITKENAKDNKAAFGM